MLEHLVLVMCLQMPGTSACDNMSQAYFRYSHLDEWGQEFANKNKKLVFTLGTGAVIVKRDITFAPYRNIVFSVRAFPQNHNEEEHLNVRWSYGW
jgi:hypothetical protein